MDPAKNQDIEEILSIEDAEPVISGETELEEEDAKTLQKGNLSTKKAKKPCPPIKEEEEEEEEEEEVVNASPTIKSGKGKYVGLYKDGTGKGAVIPEPVETDTSSSDKKLKANVAAKKAMREDIEPHMNAMFDGEELTETFRTKAATIFETALNERVDAIKSELEEDYSNRLIEEVNTVKDGLTSQLDAYLNYVVEEWVEENRIAIEKGIRTEIAEDFMTGLRNLFLEHDINVPESKIELTDKLTESVETLKGQLDEEMNRNVTLTKEIAEYRKAAILSEATSDLAETEKQRFSVLTEDLSFKNEDELRQKVGIIKESYFGNKKPVIREENYISTENEIDEVATGSAPKAINESVKGYADMISRLNRR